MFELSVACKYLLPRRRQLSVSIISLISMLVISLVVWLIVVFFSITDGLENNWIQKLTALTAPVRITPTPSYYNSYYYQIDTISQASDYQSRTIRQKKEALLSDPYDPTEDQEIPPSWPAPDLNPSDGSMKDLVKLVYQSIDEIKGVSNLQAQDFEIASGHVTLSVSRESDSQLPFQKFATKSSLSFPAFVTNFEPQNGSLNQALIPLNNQDLNNVLYRLSSYSQGIHSFFDHVKIDKVKTPVGGWKIPSKLLPEQFQWKVFAIYHKSKLVKILIPTDTSQLNFLATLEENPELNMISSDLVKNKDGIFLKLQGGSTLSPLSNRTPLTLASETSFSAYPLADSIATAQNLENLSLEISLTIQGSDLKGTVPFRGLEIAHAEINLAKSVQTPWIHSKDNTLILPRDQILGEGILLPKTMKEGGVLVGDTGYISYYSPTASVIQEQQLPVYVAGFYDQGIIPIGGKLVLANRELLSIIRPSLQPEEGANTNGINLRFSSLDQADNVKEQLLKNFKDKGIQRYWNVETFREYEFTKGIIQELQSQKNIFSVIAVVIIIVACSNIISMLVILVNDKKVEIGILRSMGATSKSIALIFGLAGGIIGAMGSLLGILAAIVTVKNLQGILGFFSRIQGYDLFNTAFYGTAAPQELSYEALSFVIGATILISLLAGIVPAVKACLVRPSSILRSAG